MKFKIFLFFLFLSSNFLQADENLVDKNEIHKNLRCLVCQGQSIADSNSEFAQSVKLVVDDLISEGKSESEIYSFMAEKYGQWIVYKPELNKTNFLLWFLPYLIFFLGGYLIFFLFKKKKV
jgi:cytochrome c-type biogenesis protein CcmH